MDKVRVTREFSFEMAHTLEGYDGACSQIHGHSYRLMVTVKGEPSADPASPKQGMVIDFGVLKQVVNRTIVDHYDHTLLLRRMPDNENLIRTLQRHFERIEVVDYQPTCENLIIRIAEILKGELPLQVELFSLRLHETANSYAEWFAEDNY